MPAPSPPEHVERFLALDGEITDPIWLDDDGARVGREFATMVQLDRRLPGGGIFSMRADLDDLPALAEQLGLAERTA